MYRSRPRRPWAPSPIAALTLKRVRRLLMLDFRVLDEVRVDTRATVASLLVAAVSMFLMALGGWLWWVTNDFGDSASVFVKSVLFGTACAFALWLAWLLVAYAVLQRLTGTPMQVEPLIRTAGMATVPLAFGLLMVVPVVSFALGIGALGIWLLTTQAAIERAAGMRSGPALVANAAGFLVWLIVLSLLATDTNQLGPGPFLAESLVELLIGLDGPVVD